jgi:hypothetical protein
MNPNSLFAATKRGRPTNPHARRLDVEADLKPLLEFLQSAGLSQEQVAKVGGGMGEGGGGGEGPGWGPRVAGGEASTAEVWVRCPGSVLSPCSLLGAG